MKRGHHIAFFTFAVLASFVFAGDAMAADPSGQFTGLLDLVKNNSDTWFATLKGYATTVFWSLALIQLIWTFFPLVFKQADLGEIAGELVRFVLVIGFFYFLLTNCQDIASRIVNSLWIAGGQASGTGTLTPGGIFDVAVKFAKTIGSVETWNPLVAMMVALSGLIVLLCFAFIAAFMGLTIIESYIVINASVIFMGFGASVWTRDYAIAMLRYAVAVGAKLFVLSLLVGLIVQSATQWQAAYNNTDQASMWTMIGLALACAYFCKTLPELIAGLISGVSPGGGGGIGMMAAAGAAGATAAVGAIATAATAGAAAPAAVAGTAAAGGGASAAGSGGLAAAINSSIAGGGAAASGAGSAASGAGAAGAGATGAGTVTGGSTAAGTASKVGSGATSSASTGGAPQQATSGQAGQAGQAIKDAAKQAAKAPSSQEDSSVGPTGTVAPIQKVADQAGTANAASSAERPAEPTPKEGGVLSALSGSTRFAGVMSAISVPGMEGAAGLSVAAPPTSSNAKASEEGDMEVSGADEVAESNTIRGAGSEVPPPPQGVAGPAPSAAVDVTGPITKQSEDKP